MTELLPVEILRDISLAVGVVFVLALLLPRVGLLALRREVVREREIADEYKKAWQAEHRVNVERSKQFDMLIKYAENGDRILTALDTASRNRRGGL